MKPKHPLVSRTTWFGISVVLLGIAELVQDSLAVLLVDVAPKTGALVTIGIGATIIVLRFLTGAPLSWKANEHV